MPKIPKHQRGRGRGTSRGRGATRGQLQLPSGVLLHGALADAVAEHHRVMASNASAVARAARATADAAPLGVTAPTTADGTTP